MHTYDDESWIFILVGLISWVVGGTLLLVGLFAIAGAPIIW